MKFSQSVKLSLTLYAATLFSGCAPHVELSVPTEEVKIQTVAHLPIDYPSDVSRERVEYLRSAFLAELGGSGFIVLDDSIVKRICSTPDCPDKTALVKQYGVDGFVRLRVSSIYRANVFAGYVNTISGEAKLIDGSNKELATVTNTENEKGGLLFNSGQVFQGLSSTYDNLENAGDDGFNRLAEKFAKTLVSKLPAAPNKEVSEAVDTQISAVDSRPLGFGRFEVCVEGTPNSIATLIINRHRSALRSVNAGKYCGAFLLAGLIDPDSKVAAELRSPYGVSTRKDLSIDPFLLCDPVGVVQTISPGKLTLSCISSDEACKAKLARCEKSKLWVYRGEGEVGPFRRSGFIVPVKGWSGPAQPNSLVILAESPNGASSIPLELSGK